jgi:hypothetical protein
VEYDGLSLSIVDCRHTVRTFCGELLVLEAELSIRNLFHVMTDPYVIQNSSARADGPEAKETPLLRWYLRDLSAKVDYGILQLVFAQMSFCAVAFSRLSTEIRTQMEKERKKNASTFVKMP